MKKRMLILLSTIVTVYLLIGMPVKQSHGQTQLRPTDGDINRAVAAIIVRQNVILKMLSDDRDGIKKEDAVNISKADNIIKNALKLPNILDVGFGFVENPVDVPDGENVSFGFVTMPYPKTEVPKGFGFVESGGRPKQSR